MSYCLKLCQSVQLMAVLMYYRPSPPHARCSVLQTPASRLTQGSVPLPHPCVLLSTADRGCVAYILSGSLFFSWEQTWWRWRELPRQGKKNVKLVFIELLYEEARCIRLAQRSVDDEVLWTCLLNFHNTRNNEYLDFLGRPCVVKQVIQSVM